MLSTICVKKITEFAKIFRASLHWQEQESMTDAKNPGVSATINGKMKTALDFP
jgi:hypothetical protein